MVKIRKILKTSYVALWKSDISDKQELRKKCLYLELFWSAISAFGLNTKRYGIRNISVYSVRMREKRVRITPNTNIFHAVRTLKDRVNLEMV